MEKNITAAENERINNLLHLMPQWNHMVYVTVDYLQIIYTPVAKVKMQYSNINPDATNHDVK